MEWKHIKIALTQRWDDVNSRLQRWVWTEEWPTYAKWIMQRAGISDWSKFSELSEDQMESLVSEHLKKESPNFFNEII